MYNPEFGTGIWMFQQFVDRYATDAYGPPVCTLEAIERAAAVGDIKVLDINYPFAGDDVTVEQVRETLRRTGLRAQAITPHLYMREFQMGSFTNPDAAVRRKAVELCKQGIEVAQKLDAKYLKFWPGQDGFDYPFQVDYAPNTSGDVTDLYRYSAFGELAEQAGTTVNPYHYTGQQFDAVTGLYSLRARFYNPIDGRFLSRDRAPVDVLNPVELNRYVYTRNSPIDFGDPTGYMLMAQQGTRKDTN